MSSIGYPILTEGLSLFFLVLSVYFLKSDRQYNWIFAGIAIGLTFGSRYPIFILAITLFIIESIVRPGVRKKFFGNALVGMVPVMLLIIMVILLKVWKLCSCNSTRYPIKHTFISILF